MQRILRQAKPHVTKERYIKALAPEVLEAMQRMQVVVESLASRPAVGQQQNCRASGKLLLSRLFHLTERWPSG